MDKEGWVKEQVSQPISNQEVVPQKIERVIHFHQ